MTGQFMANINNSFTLKEYSLTNYYFEIEKKRKENEIALGSNSN